MAGGGSVELGTGYISVVPSAKGFQKDLDRQIGQATSGASKAGEDIGKRMSSGMTKALKVGAAAAGAAAVAGIGLAVKGGLESALNVDAATRSLTGLHGSAEKAADTIARVGKVSRDSSIDHADYAEAAKNLAYIGVEGDQLESILTNAGDAIVGFGGDGSNLERVNDSLSKMVNNGKVNREELLQLSDAGIPIFEGLSTHLGVTVEEMNKMVSDGVVGIEDVLSVMENGTGAYFGQLLDAGGEMEKGLGATWSRLKDNLKLDIGEAITNSGILDAMVPMMSSLGDVLLGAVDSAVAFAGAMQDVGGWIRDNHAWIGPLAAAIGGAALAWGAWVGAIKLWQRATKVAAGIQVAFNAVMAANPIMLIVIAIAALVAGLIYFFTQTETGKAVWDSLVQAFATGWEWVQNAFTVAWGFIQPILQGLWTAVQFVGAVFATIIMGTVLTAWNLFAAVLSMVWNTIIKPVWDAFAAVMTWLWNVVVMPIWNAMKLGLNLLGAAFTFVWNSIIKPVWDALGAGIAFVWTTLIQPAWNAMKAALAAVGMAFQTAWNTVIKPVWNALGTGIRTVIDTVVMPAWDLMKRGLDTVKGHFDRAVDGIKSVWESLSAALRKPIDFLIDVVWNRGLVPAWNRVREFLPDLPEAVPMAGFATGGAVNGPGTGTSDSIMARLSTGEHVLTAAEVDALGGHNVIYAIRALIKRGTPFNWDQVQGLSQWPAASLKGLASGSNGNRGDAGLPGFAKGGEVRPAWHAQLENGHRAAKMRNGNPYTWGFEDCSGYMSMIADAILNGGDGVRKWATGSFPGGQPWVPGLGEGFSVGVHDNPGGPGGGHTSGTLSGVGPYSSVNVESGGSHGHVAYGGPAAGADSPQWVGVHPGQFHLGIGADGAFESGGGPSPEAQRSVIKEKIKEILDKALEPITGGMANAIGSPPPPYLDIPPQSLTATKDAAVDAAFSAVESVGSGLRTVYDSAKDVVTGITGGFTGLFRDQGGWIPNGLSMVRNETGRPEAVLNWDQIKQLQDLLDSLSVTARDSFLKSTKSGVADFFGVSGIVDTIEEVMKGSGGSGVSTDAATVSIDTAEVVIDSPAALPTTATDLPGATDFGYENKSVELETKMPDLDTSAPGSGPVKDQVREAFAAHGWDKGAQWDAVEYIVGKESSWNPTIRNPSSGAFGLFQFLGGTKDTYLPDENPNPKIQGAAGAKYIKDRYGDPLAARAFWEQNGWYDQGGWLKTGVTLTRNDTGKPEAILNPSQWSAISRQTDLVSEIAQNGGGGPMVVIEHMEARNEAEAMRAASREARRLTRSTALVGGWRS